MTDAKNMRGLRVVAKSKFIGYQFLVDLSVNYNTDTHKSTNTYLIAVKNPSTGEVTRVITHNTVSLLGNVAPGCHFPMSKYYIRRVRVPTDFPLLKLLKDAGYNVEPCIGSEKTTSVVEFPMKYDNDVRKQSDVSMWEMFALTAYVQKYWADNQVSVTITFDPETEGNQIKHALDYFQSQLKSVSLLPRKEYVFPQMPYETITAEKYHELMKNISPIDVNKLVFKNNAETEEEQDAYCDGEKCVIPGK